MHLSILALLASVSLAMAVPFPSDHYQLTRRTYYGSDVEDDAWMHEEDDSPRLSYNAAPLSRTKSSSLELPNTEYFGKHENPSQFRKDSMPGISRPPNYDGEQWEQVQKLTHPRFRHMLLKKEPQANTHMVNRFKENAKREERDRKAAENKAEFMRTQRILRAKLDKAREEGKVFKKQSFPSLSQNRGIKLALPRDTIPHKG